MPVIFYFQGLHKTIKCSAALRIFLQFPYIATYENTKMTLTIQFLALEVMYDLSALKVL